MMEPTFWIIIAAVLIVFVLAARYLLSGEERQDEVIDPLYVSALEAIARNDERSAIQYLKMSIGSSPSSFAPYLLLGDLLRKRGDVDRALKIHRELSLRPNLNEEKRLLVLKSLVKDQIACSLFADAVTGCKKILEIDGKDREGLELLLSSYEGNGMWDEAIDVAKKFSRLFLTSSGLFMAHYLSFAASEELKSGNREAAKKKLKRALTHDPTCQPALIHLGDVYFDEKDYAEAIEVWSNFLKINPEAIADLSSRLEKAYFEKGHFSRMTEVYEDLSHNLPSSPDVLIGLARMYHRRGEIDAALRLAVEARQLDPDNPNIYRTLVDLYSEKREYDPLVKILREYFKEIARGSGKFECRSCRYTADGFFWKCPGCGDWQVDFPERSEKKRNT